MFQPNDQYKIRAYDELLAALVAATQDTADRHTDERTPVAAAVGWEPQRWTDKRGWTRVAINLIYSLPEVADHPDAGQGLIESGVIGCNVDADNPLMTGEWFSREAQAWNNPPSAPPADPIAQALLQNPD